MTAILFRIALLTLGFAAVELRLPPALSSGAIDDWVVTALGLVLIVAGSAGFIGPLLGGAVRKGDSNHA